MLIFFYSNCSLIKFFPSKLTDLKEFEIENIDYFLI